MIRSHRPTSNKARTRSLRRRIVGAGKLTGCPSLKTSGLHISGTCIKAPRGRRQGRRRRRQQLPPGSLNPATADLARHHWAVPAVWALPAKDSCDPPRSCIAQRAQRNPAKDGPSGPFRSRVLKQHESRMSNVALSKPRRVLFRSPLEEGSLMAQGSCIVCHQASVLRQPTKPSKSCLASEHLRYLPFHGKVHFPKP